MLQGSLQKRALEQVLARIFCWKDHYADCRASSFRISLLLESAGIKRFSAHGVAIPRMGRILLKAREEDSMS